MYPNDFNFHYKMNFICNNLCPHCLARRRAKEHWVVPLALLCKTMVRAVDKIYWSFQFAIRWKSRVCTTSRGASRMTFDRLMFQGYRNSRPPCLLCIRMVMSRTCTCILCPDKDTLGKECYETACNLKLITFIY